MPYSNGKITIPNVSGNIVIAVTTAGALVNLFDKNDADVALNCRINSSGNAVNYGAGQLVTGFISAQVGDTFTVETDSGNNANGYTGVIAMYNSSKTYIGQLVYADGKWTWSADYLTGTLTIPSTSSGKDYTTTAYVRFCLAYTDIDNIHIYKQ